MSELRELAALSVRIGRDPEQVQAAGGNSSIKQGGVLWVKASGLWLRDALDRALFVPVDLAAVRRVIGEGNEADVRAATLEDRNPAGLRPSIETSLHALLPQRIVLHTHSVRTIAHAIREDAQALLQEKLGGLAWVWVPYVHPGLALTRAIRDAIGTCAVDVVVMGNHGLVITSDTVEGAAARLEQVERRLDLPTTAASTTAPSNLPPGLRPVAHGKAHALAHDATMRKRALSGSFYPDHVIFLGPAARTGTEDGSFARLTLLEGQGAFLPADAGPSADELALCLALVLERVPQEAALVRLTPGAEAALLDWDAEKYRQALQRAL